MPVKFQKNDPRINRKGRPKKEFSLTQGLRDFLSETEPKTKKQFRELLTQKLIALALRGDMTAIKMIFDYIDGRPKPIQEAGDNGIPKEIEINMIVPKEKALDDEAINRRITDAIAEGNEEQKKEIERRAQERLKELVSTSQLAPNY